MWQKQHFGNPELFQAVQGRKRLTRGCSPRWPPELHFPSQTWNKQPTIVSLSSKSVPWGPWRWAGGFRQGFLGVKKTTWKMLTTCSNEANRFTAEVQMQFNWSIKFHIFHNSRWTNKTCFWLLTELPEKEVRTWEPQTRTRLDFHILFLRWLTEHTKNWTSLLWCF